MSSEEEKEKIKNYLNNRLKDYEKNIHELKKRYRIVKVFFWSYSDDNNNEWHSDCEFIIYGASTTWNNDIGYGRCAFCCFVNEIQSEETQNTIARCDKTSKYHKNKLEYVIMCNGDVDLSTFVMELNAK